MADIAYLLSLNPELESHQVNMIKNGYGSTWESEDIRKWTPLVTSLGVCWYLLQIETTLPSKTTKSAKDNEYFLCSDKIVQKIILDAEQA